MSSENERIRKEIYEKLDAIEEIKVELKKLVKQLPQNGDTEESDDTIDAAIKIIEQELRALTTPPEAKTPPLKGAAKLKKLMRLYAKINTLTHETDVEALLHARGDKEE